MCLMFYYYAMFNIFMHFASAGKKAKMIVGNEMICRITIDTLHEQLCVSLCAVHAFL